MTYLSTVEAKCPECGSAEVVMDRETGETVCGACGLVVGEGMMDRGPDWRASSQEERDEKMRVGPPIDVTHYDKGLPTMIKVDEDAFGRPLSPEVRQQMWRLRRWNLRARLHTSASRNLAKAMAELELLSDKLSLPPFVRETAAVIYRRALGENLVQGRSIAAIVAASIFAACRIHRTSKTLREVAHVSTRREKEIFRSYRLILRSLGLDIPLDGPLDHVSKIAERAGVSGEVQGLAVRILQEAREKRAVGGKDPTGLAAAALYVAGLLRGEKMSQKDIARAADLTEVTIRNRKRELTQKLHLGL